MNETLIFQYLQKNLSKEERRKFMEWLHDDPSNMELFKSMKKAWVLSASVIHVEGQDTNAEYKRFTYRFLRKEKQARLFSGFSYVQLLKFAAVFLLAFVLSYGAFRLGNKDHVRLSSTFNEVITKAGEKTMIQLADGSKIWVNSCSRLRYPANLTSRNIEMYLDGEAYFDFKKIPDRKITVSTSRINIKVIGTAFNLKSYSDENTIETTLIRGKIAIEESASPHRANKQVMLSPNQSATYFKNNPNFVVQTIEESQTKQNENTRDLEVMAEKKRLSVIVKEHVNTESQTMWKEGQLIFQKEPLEVLCKKMERWYNVKINILDDRLKKVRYSGTFDKETVEQAMKALSYPVPFTFSMQKDSITIFPK